MPADAIRCRKIEIIVDDGSFEDAVRSFRRLVSARGVFRDLKLHRYFRKPSDKRRDKRWFGGARQQSHARAVRSGVIHWTGFVWCYCRAPYLHWPPD